MYNLGDKDHIKTGTQQIKDTEPYFRDSMDDCDKTNQLFEDIADRAHDFFN